MAMTAARTAEQALGELAELREQITPRDAELMALYERRRALYAELRAMDPPVTQRRIAEVAGVTEAAVIAALRKPPRPA